MKVERKTKKQLIEELNQLRHQLNNEKKQKISPEEALLNSEENWRSITEYSPDHIMLLDRDAKIKFINRTVPDLTIENVIDQTVYNFMPEEFHKTASDAYKRVLKTGKPDGYTTRYDSSDGKALFFETRVGPVFDGDKNVVGLTCSSREVTRCVVTENALSKVLDQEEAIAKLSESVISMASIDDISFLVHEYSLKLTNSRHGYVGYIDPDTGHLVSPTLTRDVWDICQVGEKKAVFEKFTGLWGWVLNNKKPIIANSPSEDPRSSGTPEGHVPIEKFLSVPAIIDDNLVGQIAVANPETDYDDNDLKILERMAALYAITIQRQRSAERLQKAHDDLEKRVEERTARLATANEALGGEVTERKLAEKNLRKALIDSKKRSNEIKAMLKASRIVLENREFRYTAKAIFDASKDLIGATSGYVALLNKNGDENEVLFLDSGTLSCTVDPEIPMPIRGLREKAYKSGKVVSHNDFSNSEWKSLMPKGHVKLDNVLFSPLVIKGETVGLIGMGNKPGGFDDNDCRLASVFGELAAIALLNTRTIETLENSERRFRSVAQSAGDAIVTLDQKGRASFWNNAAEKIFGYSSDEMVGKPLAAIIPKRHITEHQNGFSRAIASGSGNMLTSTIETQGVRKDGKEIPIELSLASWNTHEGVFFTGIIRDISDRKKMEDELLKAQKLESIGVLAGGIAHDFNNILTALWGNIQISKMNVQEDEETHKLLNEADNACKRAKDLTQQLLTFALGGAPIKKSMDVGSTLKEATNLALRGSNKLCKFSIPKDLYRINADEGQMNQVINNIVINADQSMPEGGNIKVEAQNITLETNHDKKLPLAEGKYVKLSIEDSGIGIKDEYLSKIFDPYFTTKQKGSGLGLATCYSIIKKHDGYISVSSEVGVGSRFEIYIPAETIKTHREVTEITEKINMEKGNGKILIMDDEEGVKKIIGKMLSRLGYDVEYSSKGEEALELYGKTMQNGEKIHCVILDLTIPGGMGGKECIKKLKELDPKVKAIVSSGYSNDPVLSNYKDYGFVGVLSKPFSMEKLGEVLKKVLTGHQ